MRLEVVADGAGRHVRHRVVECSPDPCLVPAEVVAAFLGHVRGFAEVLGDALDESVGFVVGRRGALLARLWGHDARRCVC